MCQHALPSVGSAAVPTDVDASETVASSELVVKTKSATETVTSSMPPSHYGHQNCRCLWTQNASAADVGEVAAAKDIFLRPNQVSVGIPV